MNNRKLLIALSAALLPMTATFADDRASTNATDESSPAVTALKDKIGKRSAVDIDEVRVTDSGATCIKYRVSSREGSTRREHAVVQGDEVIRSTLGNHDFEKAWSDNCLGARGGTTPAQ
jgi:hypothetical protein